ncbi:protein-tyrosine sulfotransferase-like [Ipomoea triloba]|uniref:protein-tyrosine sulfotransferase-like n=1 Tax=Ipomoea triloba TaxID=35885 RepID=UPI00125DD62D|nr:protein-tyrosine sulfotransferase-like [Ipomoea triloba]
MVCSSVSATSYASDAQDDFEQCENTVKNWASSSSQESENFEDQQVLKDFLFFLHVPRTGGKNYFHCFLEQLYTESAKCPASYDRIRFNTRNPHCNLSVTHDDYSLMSKLPKDQTSVVTIIRNPVDRVLSSYEFSVEVAARFLFNNNLAYATKTMKQIPSAEKFGGSTLDIWPWKYLVPWMTKDLFSRKDVRMLKGESGAVIGANNPYNVEEMVMPLHEFINDPIVLDLVHNGATFQVAGLTNNSYTDESHPVRRCVLKYQILGEYVLEVAKRRLDGMLYVGLTDKHQESASLFANVVVDQVLSKLAISNAAANISEQNYSSRQSVSLRERDRRIRNSWEVTWAERIEAGNGNSTTAKLVESYEMCIKRLLTAQEQKREGSMKFVRPVNFTQEARREIPKRIVEVISSLNSLDMQLYEYAQQMFEQQKQPWPQRVMVRERVDGMLNNVLYGASWKPLPFALPFLILLLFIFMFVNGRMMRRSKSKI